MVLGNKRNDDATLKIHPNAINVENDDVVKRNVDATLKLILFILESGFNSIWRVRNPCELSFSPHLFWLVRNPCKYVRSGCTTALNVVPWETDGESVLREAMTNTQTPPHATTVVIPTGAPATNTVANHAERPEKFNGQNFKRWQQKMFFYLTTLGLARFLKETVPQVEPPAEGQSSNAQAVQAVEAWKHSDFLCHNYVLNDLQSQGNYTLFRETMVLPAQNINHSAFRSMFDNEKLSGTNFNDWFARLKLVLRVEKKMHIIEQPLPPPPAPISEPNVVAEWTKQYDAHTEIACLMLGSMTPELHRQFELYYPYDMIQELRSMFEKQAGVEKFDLIQSFHACKQEEGKPVADYVLKMKGYVEKLERLGYVLPQDITVGLILNGLTKDFAGFVSNYKMHNMGKTIGEIHAMLMEYEKSLPKKAETPQVMMIKKGKIQKANKKSLKVKGKVIGKGKDKKVYVPKPTNPKPIAKERPAKDDACHHCKEVGHWKRNCPMYLAELLKKKRQVGDANSSGIFMIELFSLPKCNSWVYDTGCGTHICNTKQGFRIEKKLKRGALYLYVGNEVREQVEAIGSYDLVLPNGLVICLDNCHYAPSIMRGVVSVSCLVDNGFVQKFTNYVISISKNNVLYFNAVARNGVYEIDMHDLVPNNNSIYNVSNKRVKRNLDSTYLWHCRLAHINKKRIKQLQQDGLLKSTDDESFDQCESCLSGKMTKKPFPHSNERAKDLLGIIHTDVCGPLRHVSRQGASYFITFTDDYSRYGYVYLLKHKHEVFETFKVFKNEVENQLGKTIKAIRSDRGGEYISQEFKDYLKANGIVQQLTPPYTPQHNGVSERRNRTLLDMVRSMMNLTTLPLSFWDYALESATRILNMVPTKKVDKTPYEMWYGKVPNLSYLKVWGCEALVKRDTPDKLKQRFVKCIFIGYPKETMGYYFYFLPENKIVVARYVEFFEKRLINQEISGRAVDLEEIQEQEDTSPSEITSNIPQEVEGFGPPAQEEEILIQSNKWIDAMNAEIQSMMDHKVWVLVDLPPGCKTVGSKWLFKKKTDMDGIVHVYKARLVAKGYTQLYGVNYEETFSPVTDIRAIRILISIAAY
ncbi:zinc finger, CCHC-type containing protein, partial [Tanacetum coccineum]